MSDNNLLGDKPQLARRPWPGLVLVCLISAFVIAVPTFPALREPEQALDNAIEELLAGRPFEALKHAGDAVRANPRSADALAIMGLSQLKCGEWEKAESHLKRAVSIDSQLPEAHLGLGEIAVGKMRYGDAVSHLRQATQSQAFRGEAYRVLASSLEAQDLHSEAEQAIREAGKYMDNISEDHQKSVLALPEIFASREGKSLFRIPGDFESTSIRFEYFQGHIVLPIVANGLKLDRFVLDTGHSGSVMISSEFAEGLNLTYSGEMIAQSLAGELTLQAAILDSMQIGDLVIKDVPVFVCKDYPFGSDGLIGWKIIQRFNISIDFKNSELHIFNGERLELQRRTFDEDKLQQRVPFFYFTSMWIRARFGNEAPRAVVFDTGAPESALHLDPLDPPTRLRASSLRFIRIGDLVFDRARVVLRDFSDIHRKGRYYFHGIVGIDILKDSVLHIVPKRSILIIEKDRVESL